MTTLQRVETDRFLAATEKVLRQATFTGFRGTGLYASSPTCVYPFAYTRDLAATIVGLCELGATDTARPYADFLLDTQDEEGLWPECLDTEGRAVESPRHEDCTALAVWAVLSFARASGDSAFRERAGKAVERATQFTVGRTLNTYLYLIETTSSLHAGPVSEGYELWNNCAHAAAFALAHKVYGGERYRRLALLIRRAIGLLMTQDSRFVRRLDPRGYADSRPDMALMAPYYFGLWAPTERTVINSAELIERTLWNVEIGGYVRFLPYSSLERSVLPGPWPCYTAWMAQYHYELGNKDRAEAILNWVLNNREDGVLPEVLVPAASAHRYLGERRRVARETQVNRRRSNGQVHEAVLERVMLDLEYLERMAVEREVIPLGAPHVWSHVETLRALKRGGHIERWHPLSVAEHKQ